MNLVCSFIYFFAFYAEIQNGHQKLQENDLWEKSPVETALSHSISKINGFTQEFKMAAKSGGKTIFAKNYH